MMSTTALRSRRKRYGRGSYLAEILGEDQYCDVVTKVTSYPSPSPYSCPPDPYSRSPPLAPSLIRLQTCKVLHYFERYTEAAEIIQDTLTNVTFTDKSKVPPLRFLAVRMSFYFSVFYFCSFSFPVIINNFCKGIAFSNDDFLAAFESVKFVCTQKPYNIPIWNLYNKMMIKYAPSSLSFPPPFFPPLSVLNLS